MEEAEEGTEIPESNGLDAGVDELSCSKLSSAGTVGPAVREETLDGTGEGVTVEPSPDDAGGKEEVSEDVGAEGMDSVKGTAEVPEPPARVEELSGVDDEGPLPEGGAEEL